MLSSHKDYWLRQLSGELPVLELPTDHLRPVLKTYNGGQYTVALNEGIKTWCRQQDATLFMGLLSAVAILLHRYSGQEDMIIATPIAGREHPDLEEQIGFYLNTLPLRLRINGTASFHDIITHIKQVTLDAYEHQAYPFDELVDTLPLKRDLSRNALCDVMIILQNNESDIHAPKLEGLTIRPYEEIEFTAAKFDLLFEFNDINNQIELNIKYNTDLYTAETIRRIAGHFKRLLKLLIRHPEQQVATINYLINKEQLQLLEGFNSKYPVRPVFQTVSDLFEEMVSRYNEATALYSNNTALSYNQLNEEANRLAHYLIQIYHPQPDDIIAINLKKSEWMIIALIGILKTGAAYLPVDPQYPQERINYILTDAGCKLVIDESFLQDFKQKKQHYNKNNPQRESTPTDLAYVIYTSGSTGKPKGVMIEHKSIISYLRAIAKEYNFTNTERVLQLASIAFDAATEQVLLPLTHGACVYLAPAANLETLPAFIIDHGITHLHAVPSLLKELHLPPSHQLNRIISAGEACPRALATKFENVCFYNKYGPTEATISSTIFTGEVDHLVPIGHPLSHCSIYILDENGLLCPVGVPGELCISGAAVARGYLHQPALTAEKFVPDPFKPNEKMYRSGDIGYWLPDGNIVFTGRKDEQVKVRGYRIETGEIENCLRQHPDIENAVVIAVNNQDLAAYLVTGKQVTVSALRAFLAQFLPAYMIPAHYTALNALPLTPNGKVNKKQLPLPDHGGLASGIEYIAPRNETEETVINICKDLLGKDLISIKDNFFELGGHSLKATLLVSRINQTFSTKLSLQTIFKNPTIEDLSGQIDFLLHQNEQKKNRENLIQIEL
jgi:amino acid adenylation domain-containing protein